MGAWIRMVPVAEATGTVKAMYEKVKTPHGTVDNVMRVHSLRPHTMEGHVALYRSVLHHPDNKLPLWFLECVAVATSLLNRYSEPNARYASAVPFPLKTLGRAAPPPKPRYVFHPGIDGVKSYMPPNVSSQKS